MKDKATPVKLVKIELPHNNLANRDRILHGQKYNIEHSIPEIFNEISGAMCRGNVFLAVLHPIILLQRGQKTVQASKVRGLQQP